MSFPSRRARKTAGIGKLDTAAKIRAGVCGNGEAAMMKSAHVPWVVTHRVASDHACD
jgi:hypothetical protein